MLLNCTYAFCPYCMCHAFLLQPRKWPLIYLATKFTCCTFLVQSWSSSTEYHIMFCARSKIKKYILMICRREKQFPFLKLWKLLLLKGHIQYAALFVVCCRFLTLMNYQHKQGALLMWPFHLRVSENIPDPSLEWLSESHGSDRGPSDE